ncbi:MAG: DUF4287 domain-containing protein [Lentisphaeria bacterium]|nr:DUF4287 domain-containing protein [Candidatus Neomarinimicrobiota bacterium]MCF7842024.1 DUF4287 domain-containing protein [Lentisphaeria bacterium]
MDAALQTMIDNMPEKTGKSLSQWLEILEKQGFAKHSEAVNFLKKEHGVTHGYANTIVMLSREKPVDSEDLVAQQYTGKENLLPIYEKLISVISDFGSDVNIVPKKGSVSLVGPKRQFALIKPATKTRIDLGLKLPGKPITKRLGDSGPFGTMCTHRVVLENPEAVDSEIIQWLREAFEIAH